MYRPRVMGTLRHAANCNASVVIVVREDGFSCGTAHGTAHLQAEHLLLVATSTIEALPRSCLPTLPIVVTVSGSYLC